MCVNIESNRSHHAQCYDDDDDDDGINRIVNEIVRENGKQTSNSDWLAGIL